MDRLEHELRALLTEDRLSVAVPPGYVDALHHGVRRRRRRRAWLSAGAVVATAAAAAATILAAGAVGDGRRAVAPAWSPSYDVAWAPLPAPPTWSPRAVEQPPPTLDAPRCRASQLEVGTVVSNGATGHLFFRIPLRNVDVHACRLVGRPLRVAAVEPGRADVVATSGLFLPSGGVGGDLRPGHEGYLTVETDRCPEGHQPATLVYHRLAVTLPSGTTLRLRQRLDVACGLRTGGLGVLVREPPPPPDPRRVLRVTIDAPRAVAAGTGLRYVVVLTNPTSRAVPLHCPSYVEAGTGSDGAAFKQVYGLDCSTVRRIAPHTTVRYEMRVAPAVTQRPGVVRLDWAMAVADSASVQASAQVQVR